MDGPPILQGIRNRTLFKMACSLRARGADYPTIAATLSAINANRCSPPLEHTEIDGIVKSACRYAPGTASPHVNGEVHAELDTFAVAVYGAKWRGKADKTDRDVLLTLIGYARLYGVPIPTGVRLSVSYRDLAMEATIGSLDTLRKSIHRRLKPAGWLRPDNGDRRARDAEAFVVLSERPQLIHTTSSRAEGRNQARRAPATAPLPVYRSLVSR